METKTRLEQGAGRLRTADRTDREESRCPVPPGLSAPRTLTRGLRATIIPKNCHICLATLHSRRTMALPAPATLGAYVALLLLLLRHSFPIQPEDALWCSLPLCAALGGALWVDPDIDPVGLMPFVGAFVINEILHYNPFQIGWLVYNTVGDAMPLAVFVTCYGIAVFVDAGYAGAAVDACSNSLAGPARIMNCQLREWAGLPPPAPPQAAPWSGRQRHADGHHAAFMRAFREQCLDCLVDHATKSFPRAERFMDAATFRHRVRVDCNRALTKLQTAHALDTVVIPTPTPGAPGAVSARITRTDFEALCADLRLDLRTWVAHTRAVKAGGVHRMETFYHNPATNKTCWTCPEGAIVVGDAEAQIAAGMAASASASAATPGNTGVGVAREMISVLGGCASALASSASARRLGAAGLGVALVYACALCWDGGAPLAATQLPSAVPIFDTVANQYEQKLASGDITEEDEAMMKFNTQLLHDPQYMAEMDSKEAHIKASLRAGQDFFRRVYGHQDKEKGSLAPETRVPHTQQAGRDPVPEPERIKEPESEPKPKTAKKPEPEFGDHILTASASLLELQFQWFRGTELGLVHINYFLIIVGVPTLVWKTCTEHTVQLQGRRCHCDLCSSIRWGAKVWKTCMSVCVLCSNIAVRGLCWGAKEIYVLFCVTAGALLALAPMRGTNSAADGANDTTSSAGATRKTKRQKKQQKEAAARSAQKEQQLAHAKAQASQHARAAEAKAEARAAADTQEAATKTADAARPSAQRASNATTATAATAATSEAARREEPHAKAPPKAKAKAKTRGKAAARARAEQVQAQARARLESEAGVEAEAKALALAEAASRLEAEAARARVEAEAAVLAQVEAASRLEAQAAARARAVAEAREVAEAEAASLREAEDEAAARAARALADAEPGAARCGECGKPGARQRCSQCLQTVYCNTACQRQHWRSGHKTACRENAGSSAHAEWAPTALASAPENPATKADAMHPTAAVEAPPPYSARAAGAAGGAAAGRSTTAGTPAPRRGAVDAAGRGSKNLTEEPDELLCVACMEQRKAIVFLPCGHLCMCSGCSAATVVCPMCRADIAVKQPVYI